MSRIKQRKCFQMAMFQLFRFKWSNLSNRVPFQWLCHTEYPTVSICKHRHIRIKHFEPHCASLLFQSFAAAIEITRSLPKATTLQASPIVSRKLIPVQAVPLPQGASSPAVETATHQSAKPSTLHKLHIRRTNVA